MIVWVVILFILSILLFVQNLLLWTSWFQRPAYFGLSILWTTLILFVALGVLITMVKGRGTARSRASDVPADVEPAAPEAHEETPS